MNEEIRVRMLKALADPARLAIIDMLNGGDELCACEIQRKFKMTQPTMSHHLKVLCEAGLVLCRPQGKWKHYQINQVSMNQLAGTFKKDVI